MQRVCHRFDMHFRWRRMNGPSRIAVVEPTVEQAPRERAPAPRVIALLGNPNTGKTTLFNRLCGLRAKTANFPGSTVEARLGTCDMPASAKSPVRHRANIVDLPGVYSLRLSRPESKLAHDFVQGKINVEGLDRHGRPDAALVVADASNLQRNLIFVSEALQQGLPSVVALNMIDIAQKRGLTVDAAQLSDYLGCPVVSICARSGQGLDGLREALLKPVVSTAALPDPDDAAACARWSNGIVAQSVGGDHAVGGSGHDTFTDRLDAAFTHPVLGLVVFAALMVGLFYTIFTLAAVPMNLIDLLFEHLGQWADAGFAFLQSQFGWNVANGPLRNFVIDGVIGGIAGTVVFLPQICLLFFLISLLEDTGYLARASFVMDRLLRKFGLPGQAFVPLLSAHACAIPAIMSTRLIPDQRDRFATILVTPFLSCSARLPVYVLLISVLFAGNALWAGLAFAGCYALGAAAALLTALVFRRTILKGPARPMVLELPSYKLPSIRTALLTTYDRAMTFLRKAGTVIIAICMVLWWLQAYPATPPIREAIDLQARAEILQSTDADAAAELTSQAEQMNKQARLSNSFAGRIGRTIEPVFAPLGYDWQLSIGVLTSFAAREVFVSTLAVLFSGSDDAEDPSVLDRIEHAERSDGSPLFTRATAASLLVFYVLAMQCLPTLAVTRRETGSWKWALLQLGYMTAVAYGAALITRVGLNLAGVG
jgi:ferrous iron transport protein B